MYGYIRPDIGELRVNEYRRFRSAYCGLCEALRRRYGLFARLLISYDMTFLTVLSLPADAAAGNCRCLVHPLRKQPCVRVCEALSEAADFTVILAYRKMLDDAADENGVRALLGRIGAWLLRRAYQKAASLQPKLDKHTKQCLETLVQLEASGDAPLDAAADCFARLMAFPAEEITDPSLRRIKSEILYHMGRTVYILDAVDDYASDRESGRFNPLCTRFNGGAMTSAEKDEIRATLNVSLSRAMSDTSLLPDGAWKPITENILSCGVPHVADAVFAGTWKKNKKNGEDL